MSGKRAKALRREFREKNPHKLNNEPWIDSNETMRGNNLRAFKKSKVSR